jgi:hypothetical protein
MTKLTSLRSRLADLRRRRQAVRWASGYAALALAILWSLAAAFLVDWLFELSKPARFLSLAVSLGVVIWIFRRFTLPQLGQQETDLDMALMVERQQKIDSDLVAALQFESKDAPRWGSVQLEQAVVDYVAEFGKGWNVLEGFSRQDLVRRGAALTATVALLGLTVAIFPAYWGAFLNRFLLGSAHYPTRTVIDQILVNGKPVDISPGENVVVKTAYGHPLRFEVHSSGDLVPAGRIDLETLTSGLATSLELPRDPLSAAETQATSPGGSESPATEASSHAAPSTYHAQLPKLVDSLNFQVYLGDAWTDPVELRVIPLPVVQAKLTPTPPSYATMADADDDSPPGARQISVIEGSRVDLQLHCANKKLTAASLLVDGHSYPLDETSDPKQPGRDWTLKSEGSPFARVEKPTRYELQVTDEDGLQLEQPIQGFIRIKADQRPRISADVVTKFVLPTAAPVIEYRAFDDFGISKLLVHLQSSHGESGEMQEKTLDLLTLDEPILREKLPLRKTYKLDLAPLKLTKGDQVKVTLEVVDFRGPAAGQSATSEPLVLQVTDESGILAAISESDERSARQLDAIIKRQLGIGESK